MARSIQEMYDKFKHIIKDDSFFYSFLLVLVAVSSFGLGRLSTPQFMPEMEGDAPVSVHNRALLPTYEEINPQEGVLSTDVSEEKYVASKNGTKYHLLHCPGAAQINEENKIYFGSKEEARASGYSPASNCKGI